MTPTNQLAIPFNKGYLTGDETGYMQQAMSSGPITGDGPFTKRASALLTGIIGAQHSLLTTSCTHALDMTALLLDLQPGDEVILPSFTFCSTANAYALRGAVPVFVDCRPDTLNLDERQVEAAVTERTKAIVVVHYAGVAVEMDEINAIAARHGLVVIEDNAHGLGGTYRGRKLGSIGSMATQSFHETKNVQCGEGGALIFNDSDDRHYERAEIIREKGTNRGQFFRGMVDKYRWIDIGSSYLPSDLLAAFLTAQLEHFEDIQRRRMHVWNSYHERLAGWATEHGVTQPTVPADREHPAHLYYLLLPDLDARTSMLKHMLGHGVLGTFHYQPLHLAPAGERFGRVGPEGCPVTEDVADRLLRLPLYAGMGDADIETVITAVESFRPRGVMMTDERVEAAPPRPWLIRTAITLFNDQRVRYLMVGGYSAVTYYLFFTVIYLLTRDQVHYLVVPFFANLLCGIVTYPLQRKFVFKAKGPVLAGFLKFYVICLWALAFTLLGLPLLVELVHVPVLIAQAVLIVVAPLINYQLSKFWAFRR